MLSTEKRGRISDLVSALLSFLGPQGSFSGGRGSCLHHSMFSTETLFVIPACVSVFISTIVTSSAKQGQASGIWRDGRPCKRDLQLSLLLQGGKEDGKSLSLKC